MRFFAIVVLFTISSCSAPVTEHERPGVPEQQGHKGFAEVPPADLSAVHRARTPEEWKNPFLVIRREGVELLTSGGSTGVNSVSVDRMKDILASLPAGAWPYGRILAVEEISLRSGNDTELIGRNRKALERMLGDLDIRINWWPCA
jgi:hypothetical protein